MPEHFDDFMRRAQSYGQWKQVHKFTGISFEEWEMEMSPRIGTAFFEIAREIEAGQQERGRG